MPGRRSRSTHDPELRRLRPEEQARVLAKLVRLQGVLTAVEPKTPEHEADLSLVRDELIWVQRQGFLRRESIPRLAELFERHGIE